MLTELVEFGHKLDEKMKAMLKETKENVQGIVMGRKLGLKSTVWTRRKKETSNQKRMKKQEFGKMRRGLGPLGHLEMFQHPNYRAARRRRGRTKN